MSRILNSRDYFMKSLGFILLFGFISLGAIGGCSNNNGDNNDNPTALTENDFVGDSALRADPEGGVIVDFLEHPDSEAPENDTGTVGIDEIPVTYPQTVEQTFCWEDDDGEAMHFMELIDSEGSEILRVDVNGECVTEVIEAGNYVMAIHHDGRMEDTHPIFIIPNPEDTQQTRETDGLINGFKLAAANILKGIQNTVYKDARAQTVPENIETLLRTNSCIGCYLFRADLSGADLSGAHLSGSFLNEADLSGANLSGANLSDSFLNEADLRDAKLIGADLNRASLDSAKLSGADLNMAKLHLASLRRADLSMLNFTKSDLSDSFLTESNLTGANLTSANLFSALINQANLSDADLTDANLRLATLTGSNLTGANLTGTDLIGTLWCDGECRCDIGSFGDCIGCAPLEDVCTGP